MVTIPASNGTSHGPLDHPGIIAGTYDGPWIGALVDLCSPKTHHQHLAHGQAVKAMMLNSLEFSDRRLYLFQVYFASIPVGALLGDGDTLGHLTDDCRDQTLDAIAAYGPPVSLPISSSPPRYRPDSGSSSFMSISRVSPSRRLRPGHQLLFDRDHKRISQGRSAGVYLVISVGHQGIQTAEATAFRGVSGQIFEIHNEPRRSDDAPKKYEREITDRLREGDGNEQRLQALADELNEGGYRKSANMIERFVPGLLNYTVFPKAQQKWIRTSNGMDGSTRNSREEQKSSEHFQMSTRCFDWQG